MKRKPALVSTEHLSGLGSLLIEIICHSETSHAVRCSAAELFAVESRINLMSYRSKLGQVAIPDKVFAAGAHPYARAVDQLTRAWVSKDPADPAIHAAINEAAISLEAVALAATAALEGK